jgi:hypothetical protein
VISSGLSGERLDMAQGVSGGKSRTRSAIARAFKNVSNLGNPSRPAEVD